MKCAAKAEIARSACAKVSRRGGWPVILGLLSGSTNAIASGLRAKMRWNNALSVGDALVWFTSAPSSNQTLSLHLFRPCLRLLPPGFREVSDQRRRHRSFYPIPSRDPLLAGIEHRNCIEAGHQRPV